MQQLSLPQQIAMSRITRDGFVFAGTNTVKGRIERTNASTLYALARKGIVTISTNPDGGIMARIAGATA